jgi:hypothetical protein
VAWVKLDDGFFRHHKVLLAGRDARDLALAALCHASASLSDGYIPAAALRQLAADAQVANARRLAARLVEVGLWEPAPGGYRIHDYLAYNPSRERVLATRASRAAAASKTRANGEENPSKTRAKREHFARSDAVAEAEQNAGPRDIPPSHDPSHDPSRPLAPSLPEGPAEATDAGGATRIARARAMAIPKPGLPPGSTEAALRAEFAALLGPPGTAGEQRRENAAIGELARAGVRPGEPRQLVDAWRELYTVPCTVRAIADNLRTLRRPVLGRGPGRRRESAAEQIDRVFAEHGVAS